MSVLSDTIRKLFSREIDGVTGTGGGEIIMDAVAKAVEVAVDTDNHVDGTTNKVYTATEKTKLAGVEVGADMLKATYDPDADGVIVKAQLDTALANTSGTNTGDQTLAGLGGVAHSLATAINDFLVASGAGVFAKKTLAETKAILDWAADIATHAGLTTDVHGVGASTVDSVANRDSAITTHAGEAAAHHAKTTHNEVYGLVAADSAANKPAAGTAGRWYFSTDTLVLERDNGTAWVEMARGETAIRLAQLSEKAHGSLTGVTADQHHAQAHTLASHSTKAHSELTGIGASDHHTKTSDNEVYGLVQAGTTANRPAAGVAGRWYFATDDLILSRDNGTAWVEMARGETAIRLAQLSEKAHSSLTGIGTSDHHAKTTSFADITDRAGVTKLNWTSGKLLRGAGPGANPTEIDVSTGATLTIAETVVFNGTASTTYTDLDLSSVVGANSALVLLHVDSNAAGTDVYVKRNGSTLGEAVGGVATSGANPCYLLVATDTAGIIEWRQSAAEASVVTIVAYIK